MRFKNKPKRIYLENQIYFITSKTFCNQPIFKDEIKAKIFFQTLKFLQKREDFELCAIVLLPDHFHLMVTPIKKNISQIIHSLKSYSSQKINQYIRSVYLNNHRRGILPRRNIHNGNRGEAGSLAYDRYELSPIWQQSFHCHLIMNEQDFENHFNYIIYNPVKHGYAFESENWPYSLIGDKYNP